MIAAVGVDICEYIAVSITEGSNYIKNFIEKIPKYRLLDEIYNFITFKDLELRSNCCTRNIHSLDV